MEHTTAGAEGTRHYIATWFYRESHDEASFYPQGGGKGDSALLHSIYMQIQVPFFTTFAHYNPQATLLFFTNLRAADLPPYLTALFGKLHVEVVTLPYTCRPKKGWHNAWQNQFYLYDMLREMGRRMRPADTLLVSDADCVCRASLAPLFAETSAKGSVFYPIDYGRTADINGTTIPQMEQFYTSCYHEPPSQPLAYYGGEFIALRGDKVAAINHEFPNLWGYNMALPEGSPRLHEEAHVMSVLAERLRIRNEGGTQYVKRMWTNPHYNNVIAGDERLPVWHVPYEKKRGLYHLYRRMMLLANIEIVDEEYFWKLAGMYLGIPHITRKKRMLDLLAAIRMKLIR